MTFQQCLSIALLCAMMALFIWGRFRYDVTAVIALLAGMALGLVSPEKAFLGFSDDIVIIVGSALVLSAAVQRSGLIEKAVAWAGRWLSRTGAQLLVLTASVGLASGLIKNIGALAMLMPLPDNSAARAAPILPASSCRCRSRRCLAGLPRWSGRRPISSSAACASR
ncbi:SLC13 family permease [Novosphingobium resinovorum]